MWGNVSGMLTGIGKLFAVGLGAICVLLIGMTAYTALRNRVSPSLLIRKGLPTLIIALTTASSAAAFGTNMSACHKEYGIDEKICSFGVPLGIVTSKAATALNYLVVSLFFAEMYSLSISRSWIAVMMITVCILAIATPPIPGGAMASYTVLFLQLGIPMEALAIALTCDTIFDFIVTGTDQFLLPFTLLTQAGKLGLVDRKTLLRRSKTKL